MRNTPHTNGFLADDCQPGTIFDYPPGPLWLILFLDSYLEQREHIVQKHLLALALTVLSFSCVPSDRANAAELLTIGSQAPDLDIEHWIHLAGGKFEPVKKFEPGKVYVVEFWATWCGPCISSMPHLADLQGKYANQGVQIISISDEDLETVEKFLEREVRGGEASEGEEGEEAKQQTYRQLTSAYCLTTDPDQSSFEDYMQAAAQNGIPTSFIVGKDAKIEWIGHPMELDEPLDQVVNDKWDREAYAEVMRAKQEAEKAMQEIFAALNEQDFETAIKLIDQNLAKGDNLQLGMLKLQVLLASGQEEGAAEHLKSLFKARTEVLGETNMIAWNLYEFAAQGRLNADSSLLTVSQEAAATAAEQSKVPDEKASLLDTVAHILFLRGDVDAAIKMEETAIELTTVARDREFFQGFLAEMKAAKETKPAAAPAVEAEK